MSQTSVIIFLEYDLSTETVTGRHYLSKPIEKPRAYWKCPFMEQQLCLSISTFQSLREKIQLKNEVKRGLSN